MVATKKVNVHMKGQKMKNRVLLIASLIALFAVPSALAQAGDHRDRPSKPAASPSPSSSLDPKDVEKNQKIGNFMGLGGDGGQINVKNLNAIDAVLNGQALPPATPAATPGADNKPAKNDNNTGKNDNKSNSGNARPETGDKIR